LGLADSLVTMATMSVSWQEPYQRKSILHPLRYSGYTLIKPYSIYLPKWLLEITLLLPLTPHEGRLYTQ